MSITPNRKIVENLRKEYPKDTIVELVFMNDPQAPPPGTKGKVTGVDDIGTVRIHWNNGSTLGAVYDADIIKKV